MTKRKFLMEYKTTTIEKTNTVRGWVYAENRDAALKRPQEEMSEIQSHNYNGTRYSVVSASIVGNPEGENV